MSYRIRNATPDDGDAMLALLPRLADFDVPAHRAAEDLWNHDAALLERWLDGDAAECLVQVAVGDDGIAGLTLTSLKPDALSAAPAAHLEVLLVTPGAEGTGLGRQLLEAAERNAREHGAGSMTLHVIVSNERARRLYERCGYAGEMLRYYKSLANGGSESRGQEP